MARNLTGLVTTEIAKTTVTPVNLVYLDFDGGAVRMWNGHNDLVLTGYSDADLNGTYQGVGDLGSISAVREAMDVQATGITLSLSGIPSTLLSLALSDNYQNRTASVWVAFLDSNDAVIADPYNSFKGRMDVLTINDGGDFGILSVFCESRLTDLQRPREIRYTDKEQQFLYPGDTAFDQIPSLIDKPVFWGFGPPIGPNAGVGGRAVVGGSRRGFIDLR